MRVNQIFLVPGSATALAIIIFTATGTHFLNESSLENGGLTPASEEDIREQIRKWIEAGYLTLIEDLQAGKNPNVLSFGKNRQTKDTERIEMILDYTGESLLSTFAAAWSPGMTVEILCKTQNHPDDNVDKLLRCGTHTKVVERTEEPESGGDDGGDHTED